MSIALSEERSKFWTFDDPLQEPVAVIEGGGVVAFPTESSYGLGVDPRAQHAVNAVLAVKGRPTEKALPLVVSSIEQLKGLGAIWRESAEVELARLWPAPLTLVLDLERPIAASAGRSTIAVRIPDHEQLRKLLDATGPLTATSANLSGADSLVEPTDAAELLERRCERRTWLVVDGGRLSGGRPSTLVRMEDGVCHILRVGAFAVDEIVRRLARLSTATVEISADE